MAIVRNSRSIRLTGRKFDMCSTRNLSVRPRSRRTSSRPLFDLFGVKKFGITSIGRFKRKVSRVWSRRFSETAVTAIEHALVHSDGGAVIGILPQQSGIASVQSCDDARSGRSYDL